MSVSHIVAVSFTRLGDLVQSGPLFRSLKQTYPQARLTLLAYAAFADAARHLPMVDTVVPFDVDGFVSQLDNARGHCESALEMIRQITNQTVLQKIDLLYNLSHTPLSATLCSLLNAKHVEGFYRDYNGQLRISNPWFAYLFSIMEERRFNPYNLVEIYRRFNPDGTSCSSQEWSISDAERIVAIKLLSSHALDADRPSIVLQPGASTANRRWPTTRFAELARSLQSARLQVVVVGSKEEDSLAQEIVQQSNGFAVSLAGQTSVGVLAAILKQARVLISNDTGTIHIAAAIGTPCVGIYLGPASAKDTGPYGKDHMLLQANLTCAPCNYSKTCADSVCLEQIPASLVAKIVFSQISEAPLRISSVDTVRIMQSDINHHGEYLLKSLIPQNSSPDNELLKSYRRFWNQLLKPSVNGRETSSQLPSAGALIDSRMINKAEHNLTNAESAVCELIDHLRNGSNKAGLARALQHQLLWQSDLRDLAETDPQFAPLARFLMVYLSVVRRHNLHDYVEDLNATLRWYRRGLDTWHSVFPQIKRTNTVYAPAL